MTNETDGEGDRQISLSARPHAVHGVTPFFDLSEEEFEELYTSVTLSLSLSLSLNCESVIVICLSCCLLLSFSLLYKFLLIFALFLELSVGQC